MSKLKRTGCGTETRVAMCHLPQGARYPLPLETAFDIPQPRKVELIPGFPLISAPNSSASPTSSCHFCSPHFTSSLLAAIHTRVSLSLSPSLIPSPLSPLFPPFLFLSLSFPLSSFSFSCLFPFLFSLLRQQKHLSQHLFHQRQKLFGNSARIKAILRGLYAFNLICFVRSSRKLILLVFNCLFLPIVLPSFLFTSRTSSSSLSHSPGPYVNVIARL